MSAQLKSHIPQLANQTILVVGDVILDEYVVGQATRMSREAPIPVLEFESRQFIAGGASNPSANIVKLGSTALQVGMIGNDTAGEQLTMVLSESGIDTSGLIICDDRPTTVKTRIMAQMGLRFPQQVARIDTLSRKPINSDVAKQILAVMHQSQRVDAILLSHYHGGLLTETLVESILNIREHLDVAVLVDAQGDFEKFKGVDVIKCNADDASTYLKRELMTDSDFASASQDLRKQLLVKRSVVITRGSKGATLATTEETYHCPAPDVSDVFDTVGAGDTAIAVMTLAMAGGVGTVDAVMLANYASGIVVRHLGNYAPSPDELAQAISDDPL